MLNQIGDTLHGFTVTRIRPSEELGGRLVEMVFEQTGTPLCWVDNGIENKLFSIAFKTLPKDSTGVFHILEHSVLCGSDKYPVREPFVELLKSSMSTFLNAMTFPDKTMYPVSSRNAQDFLNLTSVYLDAVFAPNIRTNSGIFCQEGWHIEQTEEGKLSYKGVVFNEMKGAMSSVDELAEYKMMELLYPDTCYRFNSGGDPTVIPSLSYEQFLETYHRFYHPSNAYIYLDGTVPLEETLAMLEGYLSQFRKRTDLPVVEMQKPVSAKAMQYYEIAKEEPLENNSCLTVSKLATTWQERSKILALMVLSDALAGSNEAPLKRAILSAGVAKEMRFMVESSLAQNAVTLHFKKVCDARAEEIMPLVRKTISEMLDTGLDYNALEASLNRLEFRMREPQEPQGLERCIDSMTGWLHGGDPMQYLVYEADFLAVRGMLRDGGFEGLLREIFLDETGFAELRSMPSYTRGDELRAEEQARLDVIQANWTETDKAENTRMNAALLEWQQTPDTPEQLATLPMLTVSAVNPDPVWTETQEHVSEGVTLLYHPVNCHGIVHLNLYFRLTDFEREQLTMLGLGVRLFDELPTANYTAFALQQKLKNVMGRLNFNVEFFTPKEQQTTCIPMLTVRASVLEEKLPEAMDLILEVLQTTNFRQKEKVHEVLIQLDERMKRLGVAGGHVLAMGVASSHYSASTAGLDALSGYTAIKGIHAMTEDFDNAYERLVEMMEGVQKQTFCKARLIAGMTAQKQMDITPLLQRLPEGMPVPAEICYTTALPMKMGYPIPAQIGFAVQAWNLKQGGFRLNAGFHVVAKIISLSYLWNVVRVQGGAYGTGLQLTRDGGIVTYSFRDPSPAGALEANKSIADFVRDFCASEEPLDKYIISTASSEEPLDSPREQGYNADSIWICGRTYEEFAARRRELLAVTRDTLLESCPIWEQFAQQGAICVCASEAQLADCGDLEIRD